MEKHQNKQQVIDQTIDLDKYALCFSYDYTIMTFYALADNSYVAAYRFVLWDTLSKPAASKYYALQLSGNTLTVTVPTTTPSGGGTGFDFSGTQNVKANDIWINRTKSQIVVGTGDLRNGIGIGSAYFDLKTGTTIISGEGIRLLRFF